MKVTVFAAMLVILLVAAPAFAYNLEVDFNFMNGNPVTQGAWTAGHVQGGTTFQPYTTPCAWNDGSGTGQGWNLNGDWDSQGNIAMCTADTNNWQSSRRAGWVGFGASTTTQGWGGGVMFAPGPGTYDLQAYFENRGTYGSGDVLVTVVLQVFDGTTPGTEIAKTVLHNFWGEANGKGPRTVEWFPTVTLGAGQSIYIGGIIGGSYTEMGVMATAIPEPGSFMALAGLLGTLAIGFRRRK
jgi:hypothetical protein